MEWKKKFANHTSDTKLISKRYKEIKQLNTKEENKQFNLKMGKGPKRTFLKRTKDQQG